MQPVAAREPVFTDQDVVDLLRGDGRKYTDRMSQWQADSQHNVQVFDSYSSSTGSNNIRVPARYSQLQDTGAQVSLAGADGSSADSVAGPGPGDGRAGKPRTGHGTRSPGAGPVTPGPAPTPDPVPAPGPAPMPGPVRQPVGPPILPPGSGLRPIDRGDDTTRKDSWPSPGRVPPAPGPLYQPGPPLNPVDLGQRGDGGFGPVGYPPVATGSGGGYSGGVGNEPGSRGGIGAGSRTGVGAPGEPMQARGGGAAGVPGAAGKNGAAMGGGMPGKGGKGDEDKEKKAASYLQEADPDGLFGGSELKPAPPVIGELPRR
ncbi:hypothetical protein ATK36_2179 [Amycolatopsis sulphurea]|uniref:PPE family protein n=1 Tax=Amycolatopsis sulphurea TaxID=76022 RepID=A0A2A9F732_9PSEU|nr:hypothetical protein ATK36_2179 [Amycolatopsis sulphurea]